MGETQWEDVQWYKLGKIYRSSKTTGTLLLLLPEIKHFY